MQEALILATKIEFLGIQSTALEIKQTNKQKIMVLFENPLCP